MANIYKKVQQKYFEAVVDGRKQFEVRLADFKCKPGDTFVLQEQKPGTREFTGREVSCEILFKLNTKEVENFHTKEQLDKYGLVVLAIRRKYDKK
ncbi:MAG: ASCH domain protein [Microgenomates group bacterium GW2011_GWA2_44_7]|nr:MAG: ASCH domain protein [Microgenomates group bacterium GW2011_GWA2_44_7]KKT78582.1 MAG: ASCH domain protein [Microgenomates group bacterium GW2011_GWB1_44_8]